MNNTILTLLSLSVSGSILALILRVLRPLVKNRIPKVFQYYIWVLVLLRLTIPLSFDDSMMNRLFSQTPMPTPDIYAPDNVYKDMPVQGSAPQNDGENNPRQITPPDVMVGHETSTTNIQNPGRDIIPEVKSPDMISFLRKYQIAIWLLGAMVHFCWFLIAYSRFALRIKKTCVQPHPKDIEVFEKLREGACVRLFCSRYIHTPMLVGFFSPCIVIPQPGLTENGMQRELRHILLHELAHYRRRDLYYKWLVVLVSSLHWFNPLMVLLRREINRACEMACDEAVINRLGDDERQAMGIRCWQLRRAGSCLRVSSRPPCVKKSGN